MKAEDFKFMIVKKPNKDGKNYNACSNVNCVCNTPYIWDSEARCRLDELWDNDDICEIVMSSGLKDIEGKEIYESYVVEIQPTTFVWDNELNYLMPLLAKKLGLKLKIVGNKYQTNKDD